MLISLFADGVSPVFISMLSVRGLANLSGNNAPRRSFTFLEIEPGFQDDKKPAHLLGFYNNYLLGAMRGYLSMCNMAMRLLRTRAVLSSGGRDPPTTNNELLAYYYLIEHLLNMFSARIKKEDGTD